MRFGRILLRAAVAALCVLITAWGHAAQPDTPFIELQQATFKGLGPEKMVRLPHLLEPGEFDADGGMVRFTVPVDLAVLPDKPVGIYVSKMALSGFVYVNGHLYGACERGDLKEVRCLHRPYLFATPTAYWKVGHNELRFEIYASSRQSNGLSSVWVGDVDALERNFYRWRYWLQVDLVTGLTWLSGLLGVLALAVGIVLRKDSVYFWFGLTSLANALANSGSFMARPPIDWQWFSWLVFSSRFVSGHLLILMFASFFEKLTPRVRSSVLIYSLLSVAAIGLSGSSRFLVTILYVPLLLSVLLMPGLMAYWTWKTRQPMQILATAMMGLITVASSYDWFRFTGDAAFVGMYLIPYAYGGVLLLFGGMLLALLAFNLIESQALSNKLEARVLERTADLNVLHASLLITEAERSRTQEREGLIQDIHDGFGSQLVITKMMIEQNKLSQVRLVQLLQESIADLYLVVDTLGSSGNSLPNALVDFRFRTEPRLAGAQLQVHWNLQVEQAPEISQKLILQILRVVQEALNNALKHSSAANIWLDAIYDPLACQLTVTVADDGVGFNAEPVRGRGHKNMMARARSIGAVVKVENRQPGALVQLRVLLAQHKP
jgi:signal transduction histidine kinase